VIRGTFTYRRFQIIAALSVGLFLTVASALPGPLEAQTTGTATLTVHVTGRSQRQREDSSGSLPRRQRLP
jgi:hypothetical protein